MSKYSKKAQKYISNKIEHLMEKEDVPQEQAVAMAHSYAREKGYKTPKERKDNNPYDHEKYANKSRRGKNIQIATKKWKK